MSLSRIHQTLYHSNFNQPASSCNHVNSAHASCNAQLVERRKKQEARVKRNYGSPSKTHSHINGAMKIQTSICAFFCRSRNCLSRFVFNDTVSLYFFIIHVSYKQLCFGGCKVAIAARLSLDNLQDNQK